MVGYAETTSNGSHAFLYTDGVMQDLNAFIDPLSEWTLLQATGINDRGQIAGTGFIRGFVHAYVLTPVPEPASLAPFALGAVCLAWSAQRARRAARRACSDFKRAIDSESCD